MMKKALTLLCLAAMGVLAYGQFTYTITPSTTKCAGSTVTYSLDKSFQGPGTFISYTWAVVGGEFSGGGDSYVVFNGADIQAVVEWDEVPREANADLACVIKYWSDADPPLQREITTTIHPKIQGIDYINDITGNLTVTTGTNSTVLDVTDAKNWHVDEYNWTFTPTVGSPRTYESDTDNSEITLSLTGDETGTISVVAHNQHCNETTDPRTENVLRKLPTPQWTANSNVICNNSYKSIGITAVTDADTYTYVTTGGFTMWDAASGTWSTSVTRDATGVLVKGRSSNGSGTISVTANHNSTDVLSSASNTKTLWGGTINNPYVVGTAAVCPNTQYTYYVNLPIAHHSSFSYVWTKPSNWSTSSQWTNNIRLYTPSSPNYGTVRVTVTNECGSEGPSGITVYPGYCGGYYMASPNPSTEFVDITMDAAKVNVFDVLSASEISITVVDNMGTVVLSDQVKEIPYRINTSKFLSGQYVVNILTRSKDGSSKEQTMESLNIIVSK